MELALRGSEGPKESSPRRYCGPTADSNRAVSAGLGMRVVCLEREGEAEEASEAAAATGDSERMSWKIVAKIARSRSVMVAYVGSSSGRPKVEGDDDDDDGEEEERDRCW